MEDRTDEVEEAMKEYEGLPSLSHDMPHQLAVSLDEWRPFQRLKKPPRIPRPQTDFPSFEDICDACCGTRWVDDDAPPLETVKFCGANRLPEWKPAAEVFKDPSFMKAEGDEEPMHPDDIKQGKIGDCYFLAAACELARDGTLAKKVCTRQDEALGVYEFTFRPEGVAVRICVDDQVPTFNGRPAYCSPSTDGELWPILLEKAYAKLYGSFKNIIAGFQAHAVSDMLGCDFCLIMRSRNPPTSVDDLGDTLQHYYKSGTRLGCSFARPPDAGHNMTTEGLVPGHAYCILSVARPGSAHGKMFVKLRNPYGHGEWEGAYSDKWPGWQLPENAALKQELGLKVKEDGIFWMSMEDFMKHWQSVQCNPSHPWNAITGPFISQRQGPLPRAPPLACGRCKQAAPLVHANGRPICTCCGKSIPYLAKVFTCVPCNWNSCTGCRGTAQRQPTPEPVSCGTCQRSIVAAAVAQPAPQCEACRTRTRTGGVVPTVACGQCRRQVPLVTEVGYVCGAIGCDLCGCSFRPQAGVYHCKDCHWDSCTRCKGVAPRKITCARCEAVIGMRFKVPYPENTYNCDCCFTDFSAEDGVYHCACGWDSCHSCTLVAQPR